MTTISRHGRTIRKSSYSGPDTNCVGISDDVVDGAREIVDFKNLAGPALTFRTEVVDEFLAAVKDDKNQRA